jgi:tetratricopeptide (TPR) repeat protein
VKSYITEVKLVRHLHRTAAMRLFLLFLLPCFAVFAADENLLALSLRAQTDFDRVEISAVPTLPETLACVQSQAMMLPVTRPMELSLIYYRKGYCELVNGTLSSNRVEYREAIHDFEKAIEAWPERVKKGVTAPPVSSGLRVLLGTAHLLADGNTDPRVTHELEEAVDRPECSNVDMPASKCHVLVGVGRLWLGWIAGREGRLADAARWFSIFADSGWPQLIAGRQAMVAKQYPQAVAAFQQAVDKFAHPPGAGFAAAISPRPDRADALFRLGSARFETHEYPLAIKNLDDAVKLRPENARAVFVRARAKEKLGQMSAGIADLELASRTAFANVNAPGAGGQAHLYRGVSLYRKREYAKAEQEFSSALNFDSGQATQDATAWRHMAAVAAGACGPSASLLEQAMPNTSSLFPKDEAEALLKQCQARSISEVVHPSTQ